MPTMPETLSPLAFRCAQCGAFATCPEVASTHSKAEPLHCTACNAPMATDGSPQHLAGTALAETIANSPCPVVVDCWAAWCEPCQQMDAPVKALAEQYAGRILIVKLDIDDDPDALERYDVFGVPTFLFFRNGRELSRESGASQAGDLADWLKGLLA